MGVKLGEIQNKNKESRCFKGCIVDLKTHLSLRRNLNVQVGEQANYAESFSGLLGASYK